MATTPIQPMTPTPSTSPDQEIEAAYAKLKEMLGTMPQVDIAKLYEPVIKQTAERPITPAPNPIKTFAAAVGSPGGTKNFLEQRLSQIEKEKSTKESDVLDLQEKALSGHISQLLQEGNFKKALAQSEVLAKLQSTLDRLRRADTLEDYKKRTEFLFGKKVDLADVQAGHARDLVRTKARETAKAIGLNDKMTLKLMDLVSGAALASLRRKLAASPMQTGEEAPSAEDMAGWVDETQKYIEETAKKLLEQQGKETPKGEETGGLDMEGEDVPDETPQTPEEKVLFNTPAADTTQTTDPIRAAHAKLFGKKKS